MSLPRRQIPAFPRVWASGRASGVLVLFWTMVFWGSAQAVLWFAGVSEPLDLVRLDGGAIRNGEYWRLLTYQFLHAGAGHFFVNLLVLWFAGREIEPIVGRHHFLTLCLVANLIGGVASLASSPHAVVVGFSAAAAAVIVAYATIMPELEQSVSVFFVFPVRLRAKYLASAMIFFGVVCLATGAMQDIGPAGILTGSVLGWVWARKLGFGNPMWFQRLSFERRQRELRIERMSADDFISTEIDPILDKISREGMKSLTRSERRLLDQGRKKIAMQTAAKS
jgi:membrane associated rhomboid family serine protease